MPLSRRQALAGLASPLLAAATAAPPPGTTPTPRGTAGLHPRAMRKGLFYGAVLDEHTFRSDPACMAKVPVECGMITGDSVFTWATLHPRAGHYAFEQAEMLLAYAARRSLRARGRTLVWNRANPPWLEAALTQATAEQLLTTHIGTVVGRFRGRLAQWDVVNEPLAGLAPGSNVVSAHASPWLRALGPKYLDIAFHACAEADPAALRVLNEHGLDYATPQQEHRRAALLELLAGLKSRGVPVQAVGVQAHLQADEPRLNQRVLARFCDDVADLGLSIVITEMDVRDNGLPADTGMRDAAVAAHGRAYLDAMLGSPATLGVLTWGLSDRRTWLNQAHPRADGLAQRPLPLDTALRRKRLWSAMASAFDTAPARPSKPT